MITVPLNKSVYEALSGRGLEDNLITIASNTIKNLLEFDGEASSSELFNKFPIDIFDFNLTHNCLVSPSACISDFSDSLPLLLQEGYLTFNSSTRKYALTEKGRASSD